MAKWLIINGSPRINGQSAKVIRMLSLLIENKLPDVEVELFEIARHPIEGCNGCEFCNTTNECIIEDEMAEVLDLLETVDRVILVTPTYFAGIPSQIKAVLDRFQQVYWSYSAQREAGTLPAKRPLNLYILGDGGDPHGYEGVLTTIRSAFAIVGFSIDSVVKLIDITRLKPDHLQFERVFLSHDKG